MKREFGVWFEPFVALEDDCKMQGALDGYEERPLKKQLVNLQEGSMDTRKKTIGLLSGTGARLLALLVLVLGGTFAALGQQITGTIVGTVTDAHGAVVNTATVKATNVNTGFSRSAPTNGVGEYRIDYLPVGTYTVEATAPSFQRFVQKNVSLDVEQELTVPISLSVGAATQTVTVTRLPRR